MIWNEGEPPKPKYYRESKPYLLKFASGIICSGAYRYGCRGEPQQDTMAWRCDCCGRFATPVAWMEMI